MGSPSKNKGNGYERELVKQAAESGFDDAKRAWGSNGMSLGMHEEVDLVVGGKRIQAKRRKKLLKGINDMISLLENTDAVVFRQDQGDSHVLISWWEYLDLLKGSESSNADN